MFKPRKRTVLMAVTALSLALLFLPIASVHGTTAPQPAPTGACPVAQSLVATTQLGLGQLNATLQSQGVTTNIVLVGLNGTQTLTGQLVTLESLTVVGTNSGGTQLVYLNTELDSAKISGNATNQNVQLSLTKLDLKLDPTFAQANNIPLTQLYIDHLYLDVDLNCNNQTYQIGYTAQTSAASLIQSYLASKGI